MVSVAAITAWFLRWIIRFDLWRTGLVLKAVDLHIPPPPLASKPNNCTDYKTRRHRSHYYERQATTSTDPHLRRDLLIIPGFSMDAALMTTLVRELDLPPTYRIVVMELPLHDTNAENFDGSFPDYEEILAYTRAFVLALGLGLRRGKTGGWGGDERSGFLTACGYSLGGGIVVKYLRRYPNELRGVVLCSPALPRTIRKTFVDTIRSNPYETHGWRIGRECRSFFRDVLGIRGYVPNFMFDAFVERIERTYGRYYRGEGLL